MAEAPVPFMDLSWQWGSISRAAMPELEKLMQSSAFCLGPFVARFEEAFAKYLGARHVVGVNSGTSALHLAMICAGIRPGDKVLVPANTFAATAWAVAYLGAIPVFCECDPTTANIDVQDAERRMTAGVKALVPVHLYGQPADMDRVMSFAKKHSLVVVEDAAQAHGARYGGKPVGTIAPMGCFSFYPGKNLGAAGEGGAVATDDDALAERLRALRSHGTRRDRYLHEEVGFNYRMEGIQGLVLWHKLGHLDAWTELRRHLAARYIERLSDLPLALPRLHAGDHVYHLFVVHTPRRDALRDFLEARAISTGLHYPVPLHRQPCFSHLQMDRSSYPVADRLAREGLSLPLFPGMTDAQQNTVIAAIEAFFGSGNS
jgi:dTDP-4-amino-4,6-dideoxygalactose transaminase